jgi:hypothetical protein
MPATAAAQRKHWLTYYYKNIFPPVNKLKIMINQPTRLPRVKKRNKQTNYYILIIEDNKH